MQTICHKIGTVLERTLKSKFSALCLKLLGLLCFTVDTVLVSS